jgi:hypothetical protein
MLPTTGQQKIVALHTIAEATGTSTLANDSGHKDYKTNYGEAQSVYSNQYHGSVSAAYSSNAGNWYGEERQYSSKYTVHDRRVYDGTNGAAASGDAIFDVLGGGGTLAVRALARVAEKTAWTQVGRVMSQAELEGMRSTGRVMQSLNNGVTSVTLPPSRSVYRAARATDVFVTFEVPSAVLRAAGTGTAKIYGPQSIFGPRLGILEMPAFRNLEIFE